MRFFEHLKHGGFAQKMMDWFAFAENAQQLLCSSVGP